jgi:hypothetical protein
MSSLWPLLTIAGVGALHGLNPATGWMLAAGWGLHLRDRARAVRALMPIAVGHATSVALIAAAVAFGISLRNVGPDCRDRPGDVLQLGRAHGSGLLDRGVLGTRLAGHALCDFRPFAARAGPVSVGVDISLSSRRGSMSP